MRRDLPTGTVTFLFTDVERSTQLLRQVGPDRYAQALAEHRAVLREAFAAHGGVEVDTQGDAFFVAFARASDALAAARAAREALGEGPVRVRGGVHTGEPLLTDEGYVGMDVHRAARIAAVAHGGQVLVSQSTRDLVGAEGFRDLGVHRLKDLSEPERLFQLGGASFPPLRTLNNSNLPLPATPLVGRKKELADVLRLFTRDGARLVTITGAGGVGKTRFALEAARELVEDFAHGVWFVDLSPLRNPELVVSTVASVVGARGELGEHLADKELLLVLDNFEQVADAAAAVADVLSRCPNVRVLATSREPLALGAERAYPLRPLAEAPAVELLRARAEAADSDFDAPFDELAAIADRVDRLPLALELAGARLVAIAPGELLNRLEQRLPLLTSRARDVPDRQRTLRATIEWSYELLDEDEKRLLAHLSVFAGGCTLDAAEAVCDADLDTLESLVAKNLVRRHGDRYFMLETVREYARERLVESAEERSLLDAHATYFLGFAEQAWAAIEERFREQAEWLARLERDRDNLRAALDHLLDGEARGPFVRLVVALGPFWALRGRWAEASLWLEHAVRETRGETSLTRADALAYAARVARAKGEFERERALAYERLALCRTLGDDHRTASSLILVGVAELVHGNFEQSRVLFDESWVLADAIGDRWLLARTALNRGFLSLAEHDAVLAEKAFGSALELAQALHNRPLAFAATIGTADALLFAGKTADSVAVSRTGFALARELGAEDMIVDAVERAASAVAASESELAATLFGFVAQTRESLGLVEPQVLARLRIPFVDVARSELGQAAFDRAFESGRSLTVEDAVGLAFEE